MALATLTTAPAAAEPDDNRAKDVFKRAQQICAADGGRLWGVSICGPIFIVDYSDRRIIANQADQEGLLERKDGLFVGTLPEEVIIANTPTRFAGTRWTQLVFQMLPDDEDELGVLLAHELFHRVQLDLGLSRDEPDNSHLDMFDGRMLLRLEWRALDAALAANERTAKVEALRDALAFRAARYRRFPEAEAAEADLEINEGIPEYTGVMLGLSTREGRIRFARHDLERFAEADTFVRSFAYATGPALGLLLDEFMPAWKAKAREGEALHDLLGQAVGTVTGTGCEHGERAGRYGGDAICDEEVARDDERRELLQGYRAMLVEGPVVTIPVVKAKYQFNPQQLVPLGDDGTVYPTFRVVDEWGVLEVESGGALYSRTRQTIRVPRDGASDKELRGNGWSLRLGPGWRVQQGARTGDLTIIPSE